MGEKIRGHALDGGVLVTPLNIPLRAATIIFRCPSAFLMSRCAGVTQHWDRNIDFPQPDHSET